MINESSRDKDKDKTTKKHEAQKDVAGGEVKKIKDDGQESKPVRRDVHGAKAPIPTRDCFSCQNQALCKITRISLFTKTCCSSFPRDEPLSNNLSARATIP